MKRQIEEYLRARGVQYFRGHHDDEYFFLVDYVAGAYRGRLNVHIDVSDDKSGAVGVTISPDRYYPAEKADWLGDLADRWNAEGPAVEAVVHGSCDPHLVGVRARSHARPADIGALACFVDSAIAGGIDLFGRIATASPSNARLRDAG